MKQSPKTAHHSESSLFHTFECRLSAQLAALFALAAVLLLFRLDLLWHFSDHYLGSVQGDAGLYLWLVKTNLQDMLTLDWFEKRAFFPYSNVLAWSDNFILPSLFAYPLLAFGLPDTVVFNSILLIASLLNGFLTFKLCMRMSGEYAASVFAGCALMTSPYLTHQIGHPQIQFFFFIPMALLVFIGLLNQPSLRSAALLSLLMLGSFLTTVYYSIFIIIALAVFLSAVLVLRPRRLKAEFMYYLIISGGMSLLLLVPFLLPYLSVRDTFGERHLYEAYHFAADAVSYFSSTPQNLLYSVTHILSQSEAHLFAGLAVFSLSCLALARIFEARRTRKSLIIVAITFFAIVLLSSFLPNTEVAFAVSLLLWILLIALIVTLYQLGKTERQLGFSIITGRSLSAIFLAIAICFFVISLGPVSNPGRSISIAPFTVLYKITPGLSAVRAVARSGILVLFALYILAALSFSRLYAKRSLRGVAFVAFVFVLLENYCTDFPLSKLPEAPQVLKEMPEKDSALAFLPYTDQLDANEQVISWSTFAKFNMTYVLWAAAGHHPTFNGYSGQKNKFMRDYPRYLINFPDKNAVNTLARIVGLKYVVYVPQFSEGFNKDLFERQLEALKPELRLIKTDAAGNYLIEISSEVLSSKDRPLLIKSGGSAYVLELELRSAFIVEEKVLKVNGFSNEIPGPVSFTQFPLRADAKWEKLRISLPGEAEPVRPQLIYFESESGVPLLIRNAKRSD